MTATPSKPEQKGSSTITQDNTSPADSATQAGHAGGQSTSGEGKGK